MTRLKIFGEADERTLDQIKRCSEDVGAPAAVLCADNHLGYSMPIGGVVGYPDHISPSGVGYDIACGNKAVKTNLKFGDLTSNGMKGDLNAIADEIAERISFGMGRKNNEPVDHPVLEKIESAYVKEQRALIDSAAAQLGTVGAGNHYVDVFVDDEDAIWIGVHFGSRGFGHKTATGFLNLARGLDFAAKGGGEGGMDAPPTLLSTDTNLGQSYAVAMQLAGEYAYAGRDVVCDKVLEILGAEAVDEVHNHHNFAWWEHHDGQDMWVVRKGATPAFPGQRGFVGGSMGDISVILEGVEGQEAAEALYSTVHGAGRQMSRTQAAGKFVKGYACMDRDCKRVFKLEGISSHNGPPKRGVCPDHPEARVKKVRRGLRAGGKIDFQKVQLELRQKGIILRGGAADEAPGAYKQLGPVLAAHADSIHIQHILRPLIVVMAGPDTRDDYKD